MDLSDITGLLSAAAAPSGAVTAVADVIKLFGPLITDDITHRYDNDLKDRITKAAAILSRPDSPERAGDLASFSYQLLLDAGVPVAGGVAEPQLIRVRVEVLLAYFVLAARYIRDEAILTTVTQTAAKGKQ